jgi:uncharacterized membrane protein
MDILPIVFAVVLVILTVVLSVVGIQMILVLTEVRRTLRKVNQTLELVEDKVQSFVSPFQNIGGTIAGIKTGMQMFEAFTSYIKKGKATKKK